MSRPDTRDFARLFLRDTPMMDTRAPLEFSRGAFPHTVSLPLMTDAERAKVGTCYKQKGQDEAIKLGHQLVGGKVKEERLARWLEFARQHPEGYLYCFRGGLRSQIVQQWMKEAGCEYPRITGGYKAMRRFLIDTFTGIVAQGEFRILAGHTGCAKTDILNSLPDSIDLEGLAHHRGSTFGKRPGGQPSQIDFENALAIALFRQHHARSHTPVLLEDESLLIGRCALPADLRDKMQNSPLIVVDATLEERVEHSFRNYILHKLHEWQRVAGEEQGFAEFSGDLRHSLQKIQKRLGGVRYQQLQMLLEQSLSEHERGDNSLHRVWIKLLLQEYYDPMYDFQMTQKQGRIIFRGPAAAVQEFWLNQAGIINNSPKGTPL